MMNNAYNQFVKDFNLTNNKTKVTPNWVAHNKLDDFDGRISNEGHNKILV